MNIITSEKKLIFSLANGTILKFKHIDRGKAQKLPISIMGYFGNSTLECFVTQETFDLYTKKTIDPAMCRVALIPTIKDFMLSGTYLPIKLSGEYNPVSMLNDVRGALLYNQV